MLSGREPEMVLGFLEQELTDIRLVRARATYLLWLDCSKITGDTTELCYFLRREAGLYLSAGAAYGGHGSQFLRMNIACPRARAEDGMKRLKRVWRHTGSIWPGGAERPGTAEGWRGG